MVRARRAVPTLPPPLSRAHCLIAAPLAPHGRALSGEDHGWG